MTSKMTPWRDWAENPSSCIGLFFLEAGLVRVEQEDLVDCDMIPARGPGGGCCLFFHSQVGALNQCVAHDLGFFMAEFQMSCELAE